MDTANKLQKTAPLSKFRADLISVLFQYVHDEEDRSFNGVYGSNGEKLKTANPKTIEGFLRWLKK